MGFEPVLLPPSRYLPKPVSSHADMLLHRLGDSLLCCEYYAKENPDIFVGEKVILSEEMHGDVYPGDVLFNCFEFQGKLYGKTEYLSRYLKEYSTQKGNETVELKQGYAKCSCIVTPKLCITDDENIAKTVKNCVKIQKGSVALPGYDVGFIGGASFYFDRTVYFFGSVKTHPDANSIVSCLNGVGINTVDLSTENLTDYGGTVI